MEIILTNEEALKFFHTALCNIGGIMRGYGLELDFNLSEYNTSKANLCKEKGDGYAPCFEDVLIQMLKDGYSLKMIDIEGDGDNNSEIKIDDVYERLPLVPINWLVEMVQEIDDEDNADVIIQTIFFKEVIFA